MAEEATGCRQQGELRMFHRDRPDDPLTAEEASDMIQDGEVIEIPAAGAGSYREVANLLGLMVLDVWDTSSSAGDWSFVLHGGQLLFQSNRYPRHGFSYSVGDWE